MCKHRKNLISLLFLLAPAAQGADLMTPTIKPLSTTITPTLAVALPPKITGLPSGCVNQGGSITVQGDYFGAQSGKAVALGGHGLHLDLNVQSWSASTITATLPNDSRLEPGQWYYIGIEKAGHSQWLSNIDKNITICTTLTLAPIPVPSLMPALSVSQSPAPAASTSSEAVSGTPAAEATPPPDSAAVDSSARATPQSGGSLLQSQLPAPPQNLPPPPSKQDPNIEPGELVVVSSNITEAQALLAQARVLGLGVKRRTQFPALGFVVTVLRVPKETSVGDALGALRQSMPQVWTDANHRYQLMADDAKYQAAGLLGWKTSASCGAGVSIGMVDTAVDTSHAVFAGRHVTTESFLPSGVQPAKPAHGTAIGALLVGTGDVDGLLPAANLYVANVFRQRTSKDIDTTADALVQALDWLVARRVQVINLSLGGPRNLVVEAAVQRVLALGIPVIAAAGNGGPDAAPVYPAAQDGVIAVTAVDVKLNPYRRANHGDYIAFAAPGVDVPTAEPGGGTIYVSGTSYAAPFVTAALAVTPHKDGWAGAQKQLQARARDLGAPGKDPVFGWGLVRAPGCAKTVAGDDVRARR
jgi:minor extracellular protease Epr